MTTFTPLYRFIHSRLVCVVVVKQLNETFTDTEFRELQAVKGDRTWRETILQEFGVTYE